LIVFYLAQHVFSAISVCKEVLYTLFLHSNSSTHSGDTCNMLNPNQPHFKCPTQPVTNSYHNGQDKCSKLLTSKLSQREKLSQQVSIFCLLSGMENHLKQQSCPAAVWQTCISTSGFQTLGAQPTLRWSICSTGHPGAKTEGHASHKMGKSKHK
jgi:hypothetical protein